MAGTLPLRFEQHLDREQSPHTTFDFDSYINLDHLGEQAAHANGLPHHPHPHSLPHPQAHQPHPALPYHAATHAFDSIAREQQIGTQQQGNVRAPLACIPCRSRHVKCDATKPSCTRCLADNKLCHYVKSRRGGQTKAALAKKRMLSEDSLKANDALRFPHSRRYNRSIGSSSTDGRERGFSDSPPSSLHSSENYETGPTTHCEGFDCAVLDLYYENFHQAHPFTLPKQHLLFRAKEHPSSVRNLIPVLEYIGSFYRSNGPSEGLKIQAERILSDTDLPENGFSVQALLLLAIVTHCEDEFCREVEILDRAANMAVSLGMHRHDFAMTYGQNDPVLQECWRRTYWGMYVVDASFSARRQDRSFKLYRITVDTELPCEEWEYESGDIPRPSRTLEEYDNREFLDEDVVFTSFTYAIDMARMTASVLAVLTDDTSTQIEALVQNARTKLSNWSYHLPKVKQSVVLDDGRLDEMMFQAHFAMHQLRIALHRPRSRLLYSQIESVSSCTPLPSAEHLLYAQQQIYPFHTTRTIEATEQMMRFFALPAPVIKHSPVHTCGLAMGIMAQLSACKYVLNDEERERARDRIRLGLGAMKQWAQTWKLGKRTLAEVKAVARELLPNPEAGVVQSGEMPEMQTEMTHERILPVPVSVHDGNHVLHDALRDTPTGLLVDSLFLSPEKL